MPDTPNTAECPWSRTPSSQRVWRPFLLHLSVVVTIFLLGVFIGLFVRTKQLVRNQILTQAKSHFQSIVLTRRWNAGYGGVFVKKTPGVISNPYLVNPDIHTMDGDTYTKKNPALMTREVSELAKGEMGFTFHITSLKPLNPGNRADAFETRALETFEKKALEAMETLEEGGRSYFRYMAPLMVEESCLACHAVQGYKKGDVRGGISVRLDVTEIQAGLKINTLLIVILTTLTVGLVLGIVYFLVGRLARRLDEAYQTIERLSMVDELTGIYNRRYFHVRLLDEIERAKRYGHPLSMVLLDLDLFKRVNDTYGHQAGDEVLRGVAALLRERSRNSDVISRFGGEEMALLLPVTSQQGALEYAEKIRASVADRVFALPGNQAIRITASFGVATYHSNGQGRVKLDDWLVARADEALYQAKNKGRNRVEAASDEPLNLCAAG